MKASVHKRKSGWVASFQIAVTGKRRQVQVSSYEAGLALIESEEAKRPQAQVPSYRDQLEEGLALIKSEYEKLSPTPQPSMQRTSRVGAPASVLRKQLAIFSTFDTEDRGMYLHHFEVFLFIAENEKVSYKDVEDEFNITNAAASRTLNSLSTFARHRQRAIGLIEIERCPNEGRRYLARLSTKGKRAYNLITSLSSS